MPYDAKGSKADVSDTLAGTYTNIPEVREWSLNTSNDTKEYASSSTAGQKRRFGGNDDFEGTISVYIDPTTRIDGSLNLRRGQFVYLKLWEDATHYWIAPSLITGVDYSAPIEDGDLVSAEIKFASNGTLVYPS